MPFGAPPSGSTLTSSTPLTDAPQGTQTQQQAGPWGSGSGQGGGFGTYGAPIFAGPYGGPAGPNFMALNQPQFASVSGPVYPSFSSPAGFVPPQGGYGVPTTTTQQTNTPVTPSTQTGITPTNPALSSQAAGYTPLASQPNYGQQMGGTTGYKSTMK